MSKRLTYSPAEFSAKFGKERTWAYRQIHAGKINTITEFGCIMIPVSEVDRILQLAGRYGMTGKRRSVELKDRS